MPRFAANLGYLFTECPLIERFGAAAAAGFTAVELRFPYEVAPSAVKAELERHGLTQLGVNTLPGREREFGLAAVPGCANATGRRPSSRRSTMSWPSADARSIAWPASCRRHERPAAETAFVKNLARAAEEAAKANITLLIEPINPRDRQNYFLNRVEHAADIVKKIGAPNVRIQFDFYHVQIVGGDLIRRLETHFPLVGHVQIAAVPTRREPDEGEVELSRDFRRARPSWLCGLDRLRIPPARAHRGRPRLGEAVWCGAERELIMRLDGKTALVDRRLPRQIGHNFPSGIRLGQVPKQVPQKSALPFGRFLRA